MAALGSGKGASELPLAPPGQDGCRCCGDWISAGYAHCDLCWQGLIDLVYLAERGLRGGCHPRQHHAE